MKFQYFGCLCPIAGIILATGHMVIPLRSVTVPFEEASDIKLITVDFRILVVA